jgi:DNA-binding protein H-NS
MPTLEQIQQKIAKLQAQAEAIAAKKSIVVLNQIAALMRKHDLTTEHIETHLATRKPRGRPAKNGLAASGTGAPKKRGRPAKSTTVVARKGILPPKYRNPETEETWSGHARPPAWIKDVADRSHFLIAGGSTPTRKVAVKKAAKRAASSGQSKANGAARKVGVRKTTVASKTRRGASAARESAPASAASEGV